MRMTIAFVALAEVCAGLHGVAAQQQDGDRDEVPPLSPTEGCLPRFSHRIEPPTRARVPLVVHFPELRGMDVLPATFGVPFPRGALRTASNVRVVDDAGAEVPAVIRGTATWEQRGGGVRWVLVDTALRRNAAYGIEYGTAVTCAAPRDGIVLEETAADVRLDTGPLQLRISRQQSFLIAEAHAAGRPVLPAGAQTRMCVVDADGQVVPTSDRPEDYDVVVEQAGPLHAVVRVRGWYRRPDGEGLMQYVVRLHAYAGQPFIRIVHTFIVNYDTEKVRLRDICVPFATGISAPRAVFGLDADDPDNVLQTGDARLVQDRRDHFALTAADGTALATGTRAAGWFDLSGADGGLAVGLRHVWQEHPKELEVAAGDMRVHLWPPHHEALLDFDAKAQLGPERYRQFDRVYHQRLYEGGLDQFDQAMGLAKTNELLLAFHAGTDERASAAARCRTLETPLVVCADPDWMCRSDAFGRLCARSVSGQPDAEDALERAFDGFEKRRRDWDGYGMLHYGDVHGKGENSGWRRWGSRFYGFPLVPWIMFARTGEPRYLTFAVDNAKHVMDIDMCHVTNPAFGDYGRRCHKTPGKWAGGRYGGDGGIIHYGAHLYDIGCDSHVDQWTYAYYLTGYRRAWDVLLEEGEYYLQLDARNASPYLRQYAHRMSGGGMRTLVALYRATWDRRYLDLARRLAGLCYAAQDEDGTIRYDDVYMNPGMFTFYQATGDSRMLDLFLRCSRRAAKDTHPLADTRLYRFYGPAMAYLATGDSSYLGRSLAWLYDFAAGDGSGSYQSNTVQINYIPYLLEALRTCSDPPVPRPSATVTDGDVLLQRTGTEPVTIATRWICYHPDFMLTLRFPEWPRYVAHLGITARLVLRDAQLAEVAAVPIDLLEPVTGPGGDGQVRRDGHVRITLPTGPAGTYRLAVENSHAVPIKLSVLDAPGLGVVYPASPHYVGMGYRYYFHIAQGCRRYEMALRAQILRLTMTVDVFDPEGTRVTRWRGTATSTPLLEYEPIAWDVPPGMDGKQWSFTTLPSDDLFAAFPKLAGPGWLSTSAEAFFLPKTPLAPRSRLTHPDLLAPKGGSLALASGKRLAVSRGTAIGTGGYERLNPTQGTIEFRFRPRWAADDLADMFPLRCGALMVERRGIVGTYLLGGGPRGMSGFVMLPGHWAHIAVCWMPGARDGTVELCMYVNGVKINSTLASGDWSSEEVLFGIARAESDVADVRISDVVRYTGDFQPPAALARDPHTLVLIDPSQALPAYARIR